MPPPFFITRRNSSSFSACSDSSLHSRSTAPTSDSLESSDKHHHQPQYRKTVFATCEDVSQRKDSVRCAQNPRSSTDTSTSTVSLAEDNFQEYALYDEPESFYDDIKPSDFPSTPPEFAEFFPSTRRLNIGHDDSVDGNMNLRIDTSITNSDGGKLDLTLFHLRMHDLKSRDFSLRRYCRDSGREVCHSTRKYTKPALDRRAGLPHSMTSRLASLGLKAESRSNTMRSLSRTDSGYDSMSDDDDACDSRKTLPAGTGGGSIPRPTNTTNLQFSNYAHVDLKRRGAKSSKRYEFEYWGTTYEWRRVAKKTAISKEISYHLYNTENCVPVAHIVPVPMTPSEAQEETDKGGWIPPCSMWISDDKTLNGRNDVADVIVASGLMSLVDDCIKSRWHQKDRFQLSIPKFLLPLGKKNKDYLSPQRLIDECFNRRNTT